MKRIVIAGSRDFNDYRIAEEYINQCIKAENTVDSITIISGGCNGADKLGERYAWEHKLLLEIYTADWKRYGKAAGPIRNKKMANDADIVICFWNKKSKGTKSMIDFAKGKGKVVYIKTIELY